MLDNPVIRYPPSKFGFDGLSVPKERELAASQQKDCQAEQAKSQKGTGGERARQDKKRG